MNSIYTKQFIKMLTNLDGLLVKATAYADLKKFDVNHFTTERLAPDMLTFANQIQMACDAAKFCTSYLSHTKAPAFEDNEKTIPELRARIAQTNEYLKTMLEVDYSKFKEAKIAPSWAGGQWLPGDEYLFELALPNFYFHISAAYMLLRKANLDIGKGDFIGNLNFRKP
jgi:uncharacterized protein